MRSSHSSSLVALVVTATVVACSDSDHLAPRAADRLDASGEAITSDAARILDMRFAAEVLAPADLEAKKAIASQLMYTQGQLTKGHKANGHVGNVKLTGVRETPEGTKKRVGYEASMPVAWPKSAAPPSSLELVMPRDLTTTPAFHAKYDGRCGKHEYDLATFWHDWNPAAEGCSIDEADVVRSAASFAPSPRATADKYPEYDLVWADDKLTVAALFGVIRSDSREDWSFRGASRFAQATATQLADVAVRRNGTSSSVLADTTITGKAMVGGRPRDVQIDVLVVRDVAAVGPDFDARYDGLSEAADLVLYNGHAGLGQSINAFARKGKVPANKYQLVLLNGCQTFAYIDSTLTDRRREANGAADPEGTRFLDVVANALPGYANNLADMSSEIVASVLGADTPTSYVELLGKMPASHVVVAFGEEDNRFVPYR